MQIAAEWLQTQRSQWRAYRKPPSLFRMVPSLTPYDLPFPENGVPYAPKYANGHISATGDPTHFMFGSMVVFSGTADRTALFPVRTHSVWRRPPSWKNINGHISATGRPIHFMFGYRVGFSGTTDLMALFLIQTSSRWRPPPFWLISNGHIFATAHDLLIARIARSSFAIAQLSCKY